MRLLAYAKLLNNKINSLNRKTQHAHLDWGDPINPFRRKDYHTLIWVEPEEKEFVDFDK